VAAKVQRVVKAPSQCVEDGCFRNRNKDVFIQGVEQYLRRLLQPLLTHTTTRHSLTIQMALSVADNPEDADVSLE
jgi:hypothetical protein